MHELAITESLVAAVADQTGDARVTRVSLEIGRLSGVVPDSVRFCFDLCAKGTRLEGAALEIAEIPGEGRCRACGAALVLEDLILLCECGSADVDLTRGQELRIKEVEVT